MDFSQVSFWLSVLAAVPILLLGNRIFPHSRHFHRYFILVLSLLLLGAASLLTLGIFLAVTILAYSLCRMASHLQDKGRRVALGFLIPFLLLPLLHYKYGYFIGQNIFRQNWDSLRGLIIPIGISFYTFQVIGFCIDTLIKKLPIPSFTDYLNFCAFFPQIVAGPIERRDDLLPQISNPRLTLCTEDVNVGLRYIILGLFFKMVLADNLATAYQTGYSGENAWVIWLYNLLFTFRIYFDFGGYGLTAFGIARCLGITLRMNFLSPYTASNITEFWRRWHTSLTLWFRDYIYFPLGGSRTKRWALNILIVFSVSGLWHGAGWNFVLWGSLSGLAMVVHRLFSKQGYHLPAPLGWLMTFCTMVFIWMFFCVTNGNTLLHHLNTLLNIGQYSMKGFIQEMKLIPIYSSLAFVFIPLSFIIIFMEYLSSRSRQHPYELLLSTPFCALMVFLLVTLSSTDNNSFIYFAF